MSISAFCASRVSWISTGSARALICWSLPLLAGYSTTETSVIEPLATVSWTWTGPQRVSAASPVTVLEAVDVPLPEPVEVESDDELGAALDDALDDGADDAPDDVPELPWTGATAEDCPPAAASEDVEVW